MIQANELRIGNKVKTILGVYYITEINKYGVKISDGCDVSFLDIEPIPLTPEILEKAGFKSDNGQYAGYLIKISEDEEIRIIKDEFCWNWPLYGNTPIIVNYLHQLQNLIFCLCGKELNIKL